MLLTHELYQAYHSVRCLPPGMRAPFAVRPPSAACRCARCAAISTPASHRAHWLAAHARTSGGPAHAPARPSPCAGLCTDLRRQLSRKELDWRHTAGRTSIATVDGFRRDTTARAARWASDCTPSVPPHMRAAAPDVWRDLRDSSGHSGWAGWAREGASSVLACSSAGKCTVATIAQPALPLAALGPTRLGQALALRRSSVLCSVSIVRPQEDAMPSSVPRSPSLRGRSNATPSVAPAPKAAAAPTTATASALLAAAAANPNQVR